MSAKYLCVPPRTEVSQKTQRSSSLISGLAGMEDREYEALINRLHEEACKAGKTAYRDPKTGYVVFTRLHHLGRGHCCESGCRHCPYREVQNTD